MPELNVLLDQAVKVLNRVREQIESNVLSRSKELDARKVSLAAGISKSVGEMADFLETLKNRLSNAKLGERGTVAVGENTYLTLDGNVFTISKLRPIRRMVSFNPDSSTLVVKSGDNLVEIQPGGITVKTRAGVFKFNPADLEDYENRFDELKAASKVIQNSVSDCVGIIGQKIR
ncbi:hypothetical protein TCELL_0734 [Thermogladius calderae 1633]|uniref:Uncharacterized protein n=1 Tax=Thermogladius calderae (strain DSM 22663 / VKM B-2946 / 1633) TaxID=1184251 RepID=I3TEH0_THEC1|nr:hypothetical protein [Thermogladius calderae]AFK51158.1 hypothetical protein TCELL_0734 [Thermogladius calderae 1633]